MLLNLSVKNYALIEDLNLDFSEGFTVISGETGAGKSILVNSIELLTGARAEISSIRSGCSICTIAATFEFKNPEVINFLNSLSIDASDNTVLIRRTIESSGRSKAFVNDSPVNLSTLSNIGKFLIDFHNQDEKHTLLDTDLQLAVLDNEIPDISELTDKSAIIYSKVKEIRAKLESIKLSDSEKARKIDLYSFQVQEINDANLEIGEEERLQEDLPKLKNAEKIAQFSQEAVAVLYSDEKSALSGLLKAKKNIETINSLGADAAEAVSLIEQAYYQAEEAYRETEEILSKTDTDPDKLNSALERAELIKKLKKKYGSTIEEILKYKDEIEAELSALNAAEENTAHLEEELKKQTGELLEICKKISAKRKKAAESFSKKVKDGLMDLEIKNAVFEIKFEEKEPSAKGFDAIEFMFCANKGEKILPLRDSASGGELSRVLLAVELSSKLQSDQTSIFDEIDTGTGGKTGEKIGKKLADLSAKKQVFSITHLAQVAAFAKTHIKIYKETENNRTYTKAKILSETEHVEEIARMISGEKITPAAIEHAKQLIKGD